MKPQRKNTTISKTICFPREQENPQPSPSKGLKDSSTQPRTNIGTSPKRENVLIIEGTVGLPQNQTHTPERTPHTLSPHVPQVVPQESQSEKQGGPTTHRHDDDVHRPGSFSLARHATKSPQRSMGAGLHSTFVGGSRYRAYRLDYQMWGNRYVVPRMPASDETWREMPNYSGTSGWHDLT
jgi:hypothetical protein